MPKQTTVESKREQDRRTRARRDKAYIAQYIERKLYDEVAQIALTQRRTAQQQLNVILEFGLERWNKEKK